MKKQRLLISAVTVVGLTASAALATDPGAWDPDQDVAIDLDPFTIEADSNGPINVVEFDLGTVNDVVGFTWAGEATGQGVNITWASDTLMRIYLNGDEVYSVGGISTGGDGDWDFQGSQSSDDGFYAHGIGGDEWDGDGKPDFNISGSGEWSISFEHDWAADSAAPITWDGTFTAHVIPAPGAMALLGAAGLFGARRRRRN